MQGDEDDRGQNDDRDDVPACARGQIPQQGASSIATESDFRFVVGADAAGARLDRFLAEPGQLGSRRRAATALERGKVFLNDAEVTPADAGRRLQSGDRVRVWMDRPGSARRRWGRGGGGRQPAPDRLRGSRLDRRQQAGRPADGAAAATRRRRQRRRAAGRPSADARQAHARSSSIASIATRRAWWYLRRDRMRSIV